MAKESLNDRFIRALTTMDVINRDDHTLPFAFHHPGNDEIGEGKIVWHCGVDADGKILSVMSYNDPPNNDQHANIVTMEQAQETRRVLIENGWKPVKPPKIEFKTSADGKPRGLTRSEKRRLARKMKKLQKQNPFDKTVEEEVPTATSEKHE